MKLKNKITTIALASVLGLAGAANANLRIEGVIDGDLTGGNPKAIVLFTDSAIADLSIFGVGSANNGGGTDGEELTLSGSALANQFLIIAGNTASTTFFTTNFSSSNFLSFESGAANINGDDAIELFQNGSVIDLYGDINTDGTGETWDHVDGYAVRTGGTIGAFLQSNYSSNPLALDGLTEVQQATVLGSEFNNFDIVPEPSAYALLAGLAGLGYVMVRRRRA